MYTHVYFVETDSISAITSISVQKFAVSYQSYKNAPDFILYISNKYIVNAKNVKGKMQKSDWWCLL